MELVFNEETVIRLRDMSDEEFYEFCSLNEDYRIERTAERDILIMPPAGAETPIWPNSLGGGPGATVGVWPSTPAPAFVSPMALPARPMHPGFSDPGWPA